MPLTERQILAAKAARDLVDLLQPQDVGDPKKFMTAIIETLSNYHQAVITAAPVAIAKRVDRLTLKAISNICDDLQDSVSRKFERDRAAESHHIGLAPPAKPDQARRDEQFIDYERRIKPMLTAAIQPILSARVEPRPDDRHYARIKADLDARRARNEQAQSSTDPPKESSAA